MKIQSVKERFPVSVLCVFYYCATHLCMVNGSSKVCNIHEVFRKLSLCMSLPKSKSNKRQNPEKKACLVFLSVTSYAVGYMNASS